MDDQYQELLTLKKEVKQYEDAKADYKNYWGEELSGRHMKQRAEFFRNNEE